MTKKNYLVLVHTFFFYINTNSGEVNFALKAETFVRQAMPLYANSF